MIISYLAGLIAGTSTLTPPSGELFSWPFSVDGSDFSALPGLSARINVFTPLVNGVDTYNHHPYIETHPSGFKVYFHSTHDYDEEGPGLRCRVEFSDDLGDTWSSPIDAFPEMSDNLRRDENVGRVVLPMDIVVWQGECFLVADVNDRDFTSGQNIRTPVGIVARKINNDKSLGAVVWIRNADDTETAPDPVSGYPSFAYDLTVKSKCYGYLNRPNFYPKTNFSDPLLRLTAKTVPTYGTLAEPVSINPIGFGDVTYDYWKNNGSDTATYPLTGNGKKVWEIFGQGNYALSEIPEPQNNGAIVTRILQLDIDTILLCGNADKANRELLYLAVAKRDENTNKFIVEAVFIIDEENDTAPDFTGHGKGGGPQIVDISIADDTLYIAYDIKKESVHLKKIALSALLS